MSAGESQIDVRTALKQGLAQLRDARVPSFTLAAELLLLHVLARDRTWLYAHPEEQVSIADAQRYFALIARRANGKPTQHLTGKQEFWSLEFEVTPDVLIPRPETEHVVEVALDRLAVRERRAGRKQTLTGEGLQIADIGTGSGCIAIALAKELPAATISATDISPAALAVAQRNANRHCVSDRIHFVECNLLDGVLDRGAIAAEFPVAGAQHAVPLLGNAVTGAEHGSPVTFLRSHRLQPALHRPPRSRNAHARSPRSRTGNRSLRRRRRLRTLWQSHRASRLASQAPRHSRSRTRPQQPARGSAAPRRPRLDQCRRNQRSRRHPPRPRRRK